MTYKVTSTPICASSATLHHFPDIPLFDLGPSKRHVLVNGGDDSYYFSRRSQAFFIRVLSVFYGSSGFIRDNKHVSTLTYFKHVKQTPISTFVHL